MKESIAKLDDSVKSMILTHSCQNRHAGSYCGVENILEQVEETPLWQGATKGRFYASRSFVIGSKVFWGIFAAVVVAFHAVSFANSVDLYNDSIYTLKATIYDANGSLLGEFILNPRDASQWSDNQLNFGSENSAFSQTPYTVNWTCMGGSPSGMCCDVAAGALVTALSCGGIQQCQQQQQVPQLQQPSGY